MEENKNIEVEEKEEKKEMSKFKRAILIALCVILLVFAGFLVYRGLKDIFRPESNASAAVVVYGIDMSVPSLVPLSHDSEIQLENGETFQIYCCYVISSDFAIEFDYISDCLVSVVVDGAVGYLNETDFVLLAGVATSSGSAFSDYSWSAFTLSAPYVLNDNSAFCELSLRYGDYLNDYDNVFTVFALGVLDYLYNPDYIYDIECLSFADVSEPNTLVYPFANLAYCVSVIENRSFGNAVAEARTEGYNLGYSSGYEQGSFDGMAEGQEAGYNSGYNNGKTDGYDEGYAKGTEDMDFYCEQNYLQGFHEGQIEGQGNVETLLGTVLEAPVNFVKSVFNFEIMGINIASLVLFGLTIAIAIFVIRKLKG